MLRGLFISCIIISWTLLLKTVHGFTHKMSLNKSSFDMTQKQRSNPIITPQNERLDKQKKEWIESAVQYYSKVMREERRRETGQSLDPERNENYLQLAKRHYFARYKIKSGALRHAEVIYRKIIDDLRSDEDQCDHAQIATTTLLLALLMQRQGDIMGTRSVFHKFFRLAYVEGSGEHKECACSAKVLQAYALFEMKQGNSLKSLDLATKAVRMDKSLFPLLKWKQFRDARERLPPGNALLETCSTIMK